MSKRKIEIPSDEEEKRINEAIAADPDAAEWTDDMFARARRGRGVQRAPTKVPVTLRVDADVLAHFKNGGAGYQSRMNDALREFVDR